MWQYTACQLPLYQPTKLLMAIILLYRFFYSLARDISYSFTITQNTQPRGWKKRRTNNHGLGLAPSAKREKSVTLLCILCLCGLTRACTRAKLPQVTSNTDLSSHVGQLCISRSTGLTVASLTSVEWSTLCPALISWLTFSWLLSPVDFPWDLLSLVLFRSCRISHAQAFCIGFAPKQTKGSSDWHPYPQKRMSPIVSHIWFIHTGVFQRPPPGMFPIQICI